MRMSMFNFTIRRMCYEKNLNYMDDTGEWKEKVINGYLGLAWETQGYQSYLRDERITEYKKLEPFFRELLNIFNRQSASIQKTFTEAHLIDNWNSNLKEFNDDMK
jgi:hypothetical protein